VTMKDAGPIANPWMTLAWMTATAEIVPANLVQCAWLLRSQVAPNFKSRTPCRPPGSLQRSPDPIAGGEGARCSSSQELSPLFMKTIINAGITRPPDPDLKSPPATGLD